MSNVIRYQNMRKKKSLTYVVNGKNKWVYTTVQHISITFSLYGLIFKKIFHFYE